MVSKNEKFTGNSGQGQRREGGMEARKQEEKKEKEKEKIILVERETNREKNERTN